METNTILMSKILDLFETMNEAVEHICTQTDLGKFESALILLHDLKDATNEIKDASYVLMERLGMEENDIPAHELFVQGLDSLELAYSNPNLKAIKDVLDMSIIPHLASWSATFLSTVGQQIMS